MFVLSVLAVLCLASMSRADLPSCDDLVRPLDAVDFQHLEGRRALVGISLSFLTYINSTQRNDSTFTDFKNETSGIVFSRVFGFDDRCEYKRNNITLEGSSFRYPEYNLTVTFLKTSCPDCLLMRFDNNKQEIQRVYVFSKRRTLEVAEMTEFTAQVECLKLYPPFWMNPDKELCPEDPESS